MPNRPKSVFIIGGLAEGEWHVAHLYGALGNDGWSRAASAETAETIITHSGGCYLLPKSHRATQIIHINPPLWPNKNLVLRIIKMLLVDGQVAVQEGRSWHFFLNSSYNNFYLVIHLRQWLKMYRLYRAFRPASLSGQRVIWNQRDAVTNPAQLEQLGLVVEVISGAHDDVWRWADRYNDIILATEPVFSPADTLPNTSGRKKRLTLRPMLARARSIFS